MVYEGDDSVNITVGMMSERFCDLVQVAINFTTSSNNTGNKNSLTVILIVLVYFVIRHFFSDGGSYSLVTNSPLLLTSEHPNATITVNIEDDDLPEPPKTFVIKLFMYEDIPRLRLNPSTVTVVIADDDGKCIILQ